MVVTEHTYGSNVMVVLLDSSFRSYNLEEIKPFFFFYFRKNNELKASKCLKRKICQSDILKSKGQLKEKWPLCNLAVSKN